MDGRMRTLWLTTCETVTFLFTLLTEINNDEVTEIPSYIYRVLFYLFKLSDRAEGRLSDPHVSLLLVNLVFSISFLSSRSSEALRSSARPPLMMDEMTGLQN